MKTRNFQSRIIVYKKKDGEFLSVALDFDLMAEGSTPGSALDHLNEAIHGYLQMCLLENEADEEIYRNAELKYFHLYDLFQELDTKEKKRKSKSDIDGFATRQNFNSTLDSMHA